MSPALEIRAERLATVFRQVPLAVGVSVVNAAIMVALLGAVLPPAGLAAWFAAGLGLGALRLLAWRAHARDAAPAARLARWEAAGCILAALAGLLWGGGAAWLWPASETHQMLWVFVVGGMCAGAAALHYAHLPTVLCFTLCAGGPIAGRLAAEGTGRGLAAGAMIGVFLLALTISCRRSSAQFGEYQRLRVALLEQRRELEALDARLRAEVAEHRTTEASLRQAQKMEAIGQLTGGIAHDFNNLLTVVLGSLALLRKRLPPCDARIARLLDNAAEGATRGAALTQRLLAFSRRQTLHPAAVDIPRLVQGMSDLLRQSLGPAHVLRTRFPPGLAAACVDANQLELALLNLAQNARDAMPDGGTIDITAEPQRLGAGEVPGLAPGCYLALAVADHGSGMDAETLARATEPFFTTKGIGRGTGLGLPMVQGLAAQSGGAFALRSAPGAGTVATLWLPQAAAADAAAPAAAAPAAAKAASLAVLLVDDDALVLASTAAMLEDLGHRVVQAGSGAAALDRLREGAPAELLLTDYGMPGMDGLTLAAAARRLRPGLPVVLATGYGELPAAEQAGCIRLAKPFGQAALNAALVAAVPAANDAAGDAAVRHPA